MSSVPASMPPGRSPTSIGSPTSVRVAGSTRVTCPERLLATQTRPPPTVTPAGPRPTGIGAPAVAVARSMRRTAPVEALLTQTAPAPKASRRGATCGGDAALEDSAALGIDRGHAPRLRRRRPRRRPPPKTIAPGRPPTSIRVVHLVPSPDSTRSTSPRRGLGDPDRAAAGGDPGHAPAEAKRRRRDPASCWVDPRKRPVESAGHPDRVLADREAQRRPPHLDRRRDGGAAAAQHQNRRHTQCDDRESRPGQQGRRQPRNPLPPTCVPGIDRRRRWVIAGMFRRAPLGIGEDKGRRRRGADVGARRVDQLAGRRVPLGRVFGDGPFDDPVEASRHLGLDIALAARVGDDAGERLVEDAAERVDVGCRADLAAAPLLGRHVFDRADDRGAAEYAAVAERLGEAEVGQEGAFALEQDVVRLDVAVDDAGGVGGVERARDLVEQRDRLGRRQRPVRRSRFFRSPPSTSRIATISSPSSSRAS